MFKTITLIILKNIVTEGLQTMKKQTKVKQKKGKF